MQRAVWDEVAGSRAGDPLVSVTMTELWHWLPREAVESLSLEILETQLDMAPGNLLYVGGPALSRWVDEISSRGLFHPPVIL